MQNPPASRKKMPKQSSGPNAVSSVFIRQAAASGALCQEIHDAGYVADLARLPAHFVGQLTNSWEEFVCDSPKCLRILKV